MKIKRQDLEEPQGDIVLCTECHHSYIDWKRGYEGRCGHIYRSENTGLHHRDCICKCSLYEVKTEIGE